MKHPDTLSFDVSSGKVLEKEPRPETLYSNLSDGELEEYTLDLLQNRLADLDQSELDNTLEAVVVEYALRKLDVYDLLSIGLPGTVSKEQLDSGQSPWVKVYRSIIHIISSDKFEVDYAVHEVASEIQNYIEQNPQMMGPVALWDLAKDIMWRRDIPASVKNRLQGSMTYALRFFDQQPYETALLNNLDFQSKEDYSKVSRMLEALKQFWSAGHESYAKDVVPDFYINALKKITSQDDTNYLLQLRAREILILLEATDDFPVEPRDITPFEISHGQYASNNVAGGIHLVPQSENQALKKDIDAFISVEAQLAPPQYLIDEAIANGDSWVDWEPPQELIYQRRELYRQMHRHATQPLDTYIKVVDKNSTEELLFDYEYLQSRPMRELIQNEFDFALKDLTVKEQIFFLNYLKQLKTAKVEMVQSFTALYGIDGMRTFLSLEQEGEDFGDKIVAFGIEYEQKAAEIFASYSALLDEADTLESYLASELDCRTVDCAAITTVARDRVLGEAQAYLKIAVESNDKENVRKLEAHIIEARKLSAAFQAAIAAEEIGTIEAFRSFQSTVVPGPAIEPEKMATLVDMYQKNYQNYGYEPAAIAELVHDLREKLTADTSRVYIREAAGKVLAYSVVTDDPTTMSSYASGLNANPELKGTKQGITTLGQIVADNKARGWTTTGEASPKNFAGYSALDHGWVATAIHPDDLGQEAYMLDIVVFPDTVFAGKGFSTQEIIAQSDEAIAQPETFIDQHGVFLWYTADPAKAPPLLHHGQPLVITRLVTIERPETPAGQVFMLEPLKTLEPTATAPQMQSAA